MGTIAHVSKVCRGHVLTVGRSLCSVSWRPIGGDNAALYKAPAASERYLHSYYGRQQQDENDVSSGGALRLR